MVFRENRTPRLRAVTEYDQWLVWKHGAQMRQRQLDSRSGSSVAGPFAADGWDWGDQAVLEASVASIAPVAGEVIAYFYRDLFTRVPALRALFPADMSVQHDRLLAALLALVAGGADPARLRPVLERLGRDHRKFGARAAQYRAVGESLIAALTRFSGHRWTPEVERAWLARYGSAAAIMIKAAEDDRHQPPFWYATVVERRLCGPDVAILRMRPSGAYAYAAGQYATLESDRVPRVWRPYSMATAPRPGAPLEFHVRATGRGGLSDALVSAEVGEVVRLGAPQGTTTLTGTAERPGLFVAGGTGWSTIKALLGQFAAGRSGGGVSRLIVNCRPGEPYDPLFARFTRELPTVRTTVVHDAERLAVELAPGRLLGHDLDAYVAGPPGLVDATTRLMGAAGVPAHRIHHDDLHAVG